MTESIPSDSRTDADDNRRDAGDDVARLIELPGDKADRVGDEVGDASERAEDDATSVDQLSVGHQVPDAAEDREPGDSDKRGH